MTYYDRQGLAAITAIVVVLAGCGRTTTYSGSPSAAPLSTCTFGASGADVQVQLTNQPSCAADQSALAGDGQNWYPIRALSAAGAAGSADGEAMALVCSLAKEGSTMTVMDAGGAYYGNSVCSAEEQAGWASQ